MKRTAGFTVIELIFIVLLLSAASIIFFVQKHTIETTARDNQRKTAINAMHYGLEEIYFKEHGSYPRTIDEKTLPFIEPSLFTDPDGVKIGQTAVEIDGTSYPVSSTYTYEGTNCIDKKCKSYTLRATLENEDDFVKTNRHET
ncbi:hypothetical protein E6P97_02710 [Patescibacteria group bacterium]|jgi:Tfp pilus assembly protein PilE|nr:MAG: hypothetical protein E6P97_02710 [Patescibacteria group bacterium]